CPRQCALIHVEDAWHENVFTVRGNILHEKVDTDTYETRGTKKTVRGLRIHSFRYGIVGRCDVVEFREIKNVPRHSELVSESDRNNTLKHLPAGQARDQDDVGLEVLPVEFKAGEPKESISDKVQLCAQALCLEEMLNTTITHGAFFYAKIRRRDIVEIDDTLRAQTEGIIASVRGIVSQKIIPTAEYAAKCRNCSLYSICQPKAMNNRKLKIYMNDLYKP
ncbi:MAG: CRISPR-associated protein Cas4, partial [Bacteriovoracaceae bacterium]